MSSLCDLMDAWDISLIRKSVKRFSEQKHFCGFLMDLYSSSAQSSTKSKSTMDKIIFSYCCLKVDEYKLKQHLQNEFFISPNRVSITHPI